MNHVFRSLALLLLVLPMAALAQHTLYMSQGTKFYPVIRVDRTHPQLEIDGRIEGSTQSGQTRMMSNVAFPPVVIRVLETDTKFLNGRSDSINHLLKTFTLRAGFNTSAPIDGVFMYLAVATKSGRALTFFHEIGNLEPGKPKFISIDHELGQNFEYDHYSFYLFAAGAELLHTAMPEHELEAGLQKTIRQKLEGVDASGPKQLIAPPPAYPAALRDRKVTGQATISLKIDTNGQAIEPKVVQADDPAFGEAALTALKEWRFIPAVKDGNRVTTTVKLPFKFAP